MKKLTLYKASKLFDLKGLNFKSDFVIWFIFGMFVFSYEHKHKIDEKKNLVVVINVIPVWIVPELTLFVY